MKRVFLIFLSLVLALAGWSTVGAEDSFYVIPSMKGNYAPVPKTGMTQDYFYPGDDGELQRGVAWPTPRFTDNGNGTVTDNLTGLIWTKNANFFGGTKTWADALSLAAALQSSPVYGLTDGSKAGDWRLPNIRELHSLVDYDTTDLPQNHPFTNVPESGLTAVKYWSSTLFRWDPIEAYSLILHGGYITSTWKFAADTNYVWCVRGGK